MSGDDPMMFDNYHSFFFFWIIGIIVLLIIALLVANDASRYGENGLLWGLIVFFMPMMGLLIYAIIRSGWTLKIQNTTIPAPGASPPVQSVSSPVQSIPSTAAFPQTQPNVSATDIIYCTACGSPNQKGAAYCNKCGAKIPEVA